MAWIEAGQPRARRRRIGAAMLVLAAATAAVATVAGGAGAAVPTCGGNQSIKVSPYTCHQERLIDGTTFSVVLDVSAGGVVTVTYALDAPRAVDTPLRIRSHQGISSNPAVNDDATVLPAGATSATLSVALRCGQIDVKAVYTGNGDARGRVTAPYVTDSSDCQSTPTTPPTSATTLPPTTQPPTTAPTTPPPTGATSTPTTPTSASQSSIAASTTVASSTALPVTGGPSVVLLIVSALLLVLGTAFITAARDRSPSVE